MRWSMPRHIASKSKIGVIGTINRDTIRHPDGRVIESWGGILYNLTILDNNTAVHVFPVVNIGHDCYTSILGIIKTFSNIDASCLHRVPEANNHCHLTYSNDSEKTELLSGGVPPLTFARLKPLLTCDLVLVNFISGRDVTLQALESFRSRYRGLIYMDVHSLTLGRRHVAGGVRRYLRRPRFWHRYIACADFVQINRAEFEIMSRMKYGRRQAVDFFEKHCGKRQVLIITGGAAGCLMVYHKTRPVSLHVASSPIARIYDTTGCGDVFAAGFIGEYMRSKNVISAARHGNEVAGIRCRKKGKMF